MFDLDAFLRSEHIHPDLNFVRIDEAVNKPRLLQLGGKNNIVLVLSTRQSNAMQTMRSMHWWCQSNHIHLPVINHVISDWSNADEHLIHFATIAGGLFIDRLGDGILLELAPASRGTFSGHLQEQQALSGRNYNETHSIEQFLNTTSFSILQAARKRITKTEYISCPSCGRTLFDLQDTTAMIRKRTDHLKGVKIAIMGCIVNGPGEMADADFGYVGSGVGKITLYKGKEVVKRNVPSEIAVDELIGLLKENDAWQEP